MTCWVRMARSCLTRRMVTSLQPPGPERLSAGGTSFVRFWLEHKASRQDQYQMTALHEAAAAGQTDCCIQLLAMYAKPGLLDYCGLRAVEWARNRKHHNLATLLEASLNPDQSEKLNEWHRSWHLCKLGKRLKQAASRADLADIDLVMLKGVDQAQYDAAVDSLQQAKEGAREADLEFKRDSEAASLLHDAECELVKALSVKEDLEKQIRDEVREAMAWKDPLDRDRNAMHAAAGCGRKEATQRLIVAEAEPGVADKTGRTALHLAALNGHHELITPLLQHGEPIQAKDVFGWSPLHLCAKQGFYKCVDMLLQNKADVGVFDEYGCSPIVWALKIGNQDCLDLLQAAGACEMSATEKSSAEIFALRAKRFAKSNVHSEANSDQKDSVSDAFNTIVFPRAGETHLDMGLRLMMRDRGGLEQVYGEGEKSSTYGDVVKNFKKGPKVYKMR